MAMINKSLIQAMTIHQISIVKYRTRYNIFSLLTLETIVENVIARSEIMIDYRHWNAPIGVEMHTTFIESEEDNNISYN